MAVPTRAGIVKCLSVFTLYFEGFLLGCKNTLQAEAYKASLGSECALCLVLPFKNTSSLLCLLVKLYNEENSSFLNQYGCQRDNGFNGESSRCSRSFL